MRDIEYNNLNIKSKLPRTHATSHIVLRTLWTSFDYFNKERYNVDMVVGGIVDLRLYEYPDMPVSKIGWNIRNIYSVEDRLRNIPYPDPSSHGIPTDSVMITFKLPDTIYIHKDDEVKIGCWDEKEGNWIFDFYEENSLKFDVTEKIVSVATFRFAPIASLQSRCTDYPYKKWKLRSIAHETAILDIVTKRDIHLFFEICNGESKSYIKLIENTDAELAHLTNRELSPGFLFNQLSKCGIHLMPVDEDAKLGNINLKNRATEEKAILDVICSVRAYAFRSTKWNRSIDTENILLKFRENLEYDREFFEDHEPDWRYMQWWSNKCAYSKCTDELEEPKTELPAGVETQAMMKLATKGRVSDEAQDRMAQYSFIEYMDTIKQTLRLTRLLSFC